MTSSQASSSTVPLAKYLASTDKKIRDKAVQSLAAFLQSSEDELPKAEMAKLWKGIFYCYWMSDKPLVQQALSSELAELLLIIPSNKSSMAFLQGFWEAIVREWSGIDRLRMDKYYMLVRKFVNASFRLLIRAAWAGDVVNSYTDMMTCRGGPLCPEDSRVPTSLSYHLADIYLAELDKALSQMLASEETAPTVLPAPLSTLISPFFELACRTNSSVTYDRVYTEVVEPLFSAMKPSQQTPPQKRPKLVGNASLENVVANACLEDPEKESKTDKADLRRSLLRKMFEVASGRDVKESNRRKMYAVWRAAKAEEDDDDKNSQE